MRNIIILKAMHRTLGHITTNYCMKCRDASCVQCTTTRLSIAIEPPGIFWKIQTLCTVLYSVGGKEVGEKERQKIRDVWKCQMFSSTPFFAWLSCQKMPTQMARVLKIVPSYFSVKVNVVTFSLFFAGKNLAWKVLYPTVWRNPWNGKSWKNCWVISSKWILIWQLLVRKIWQLYKLSFTTSKLSASCPAMVPNAFQPLSV